VRFVTETAMLFDQFFVASDRRPVFFNPLSSLAFVQLL
jgi:hypothetical protein